MQISRKFQEYQLNQVQALIKTLKCTRKITNIHIHHTAQPNQNNYLGLKSIEGIYRYHTQVRGWGDIGYHYLISPQGTVWIGRPLTKDPVSIANYNFGAISVALIGNFEEETLLMPQKNTIIVLTSFLLNCFQLSYEDIYFHNEKAPTLCPGKNIQKQDFLKHLELAGPLKIQVIPQKIIRKNTVYQGFLYNNKTFVEVRKLIEDIGGQIKWTKEQVVIDITDTKI